MLIECPECKKQVSDTAQACPNCGHAVAQAIKQKQNSIAGILVLIGIVAAVVLVGCPSKKDSSGVETFMSTGNQTTTEKSSTTSPTVVNQTWQYSEEKDAITGGTTKFACVESSDEIYQEFPYKSTTSTLCIRKSPKYGLDVVIRLNDKGQLLCQYDGCVVPIRFDSAKPNHFGGREPSDHSTNVLFIVPASRFIASVKKSKTAVVGLTVYQHGDQAATFNTENLVWK